MADEREIGRIEESAGGAPLVVLRCGDELLLRWEYLTYGVCLTQNEAWKLTGMLAAGAAEIEREGWTNDEA